MNKKELIGIIVACVVAIVIVIVVTVRTPTNNDSGVSFADPNLEAAVREAIAYPRIPSTHQTLTR